VYGVIRLFFELGFLPGSRGRNLYGEALGDISDEEPTVQGPTLAVWNNDKAPETPFAEPEPRLEPPPPDLPVDGWIGAPFSLHAPQEEPPPPAENVTPEPTEAHALVDPIKPEAAAAPALEHPIMDWGKSYKADLNWPEFRTDESKIEPMVGHEPLSESPSQPPESSLVWAAAPSHQAFDALGPLTLEPANDLHERL
jgi:hypothetical protein